MPDGIQIQSTNAVNNNGSLNRVADANNQIDRSRAIDAARDLSRQIIGAVRDSGRVDTGSADFQNFGKLVESGLTKIAGGDIEAGAADLSQAILLLSKMLQPQEGQTEDKKPESGGKPESSVPASGIEAPSAAGEEDDPIMQFLKALVDALTKAGMDPQAIKQLLQQLKPALEKLGISGEKIDSMMQSLDGADSGNNGTLTAKKDSTKTMGSQLFA